MTLPLLVRAATVCALAVSATALLDAAHAADSPDPRFVDRVGTLSLPSELDARGALGGVCVDALGFVYVANFRDKVWRIDPGGAVTLLSDALYGASGNAVDARGRLFQANFNGGSISRISRAGEVTPFVEDGMGGPVGIAIAGDTLYVCECTDNEVVRVTPAGEVEPFATHPSFLCPNGIVLAPDGNLYVTSFSSYDLVRITPDGEATVFATIPGGAGNTHLTAAGGFLYVTKLVGNRVMRVSLTTGEATLLAGTSARGHDDGPALEATFHAPNGIAAAPVGNRLYLNTVIGERSGREPSAIAVRTIDLVSLTDLFNQALDTHGLEAAVETYEAYAADPVRGQEDTQTEAIALGYALLTARKVAAGLEVFRLNAASYPGSALAQYHRGESFRYTGQPAEALEAYERALAIDPGHTLSRQRFEEVRVALADG